jgi:hypothetical protein
MSQPKRFRIVMHVNEVLTADAIWPDGDAPENPTAEDVRKKIESTCGWEGIVGDWSLPQDCEVTDV